MGWRDRFWSAYGVVVDTTIEITANTLNMVGSLACVIGGAGFAISFAIDEVLNASYYGSVAAMGAVKLSVEFESFDYRINETIPFDDSFQKSDGISYLVKDYLHKDAVQITSAALFSSGTVLRVLGANMKQWQQGRVDKAHYKNRLGVDIPSPTGKEYLYTNAESLFGSLSYTFLSTAVTGAVIKAQVISPTQHLTYPDKGRIQVNEPYYKGPVTEVSIPLAYTFVRNISLDLFGFALLKARAQGLANATYGGGLFLQPADNPPDPPVVLPAALGASAYLVNNFFSKKLIHLRDERIMQETNDNQLSIN
ncbi:hypothetical protein [Legionella maioricensis]|uniref:Uncharacterized protein n=1 Tax=Legionella maioricensis TaxID=2896528 RepID=A0A9X2CYS7_9GAMM|nr:hypothetical protein [Legionella maioricensis]MCL9683263.1 hypothetical protein [Legionella maioricensis]MCL9686040.1 hypothetical protein [Legionella maioricensis]